MIMKSHVTTIHEVAIDRAFGFENTVVRGIFQGFMNFAQFVKSKVLKRYGPQKPFVKLKICAHN